MVSLFIMVFYSRVRNRFFKLIPAPMWVILLALVFDSFFKLIGSDNPIKAELMIRLPDNMLSSFPSPDFSKLKEPVFGALCCPLPWFQVLSLYLALKQLIS